MGHKILKFRKKRWSIILMVSLCHYINGVHGQLFLEFDAEDSNKKVSVKFQDSTYAVFLDKVGKGKIAVDSTLAPGYATLYGTRNVKNIYIDPRSSLSIKNRKNQSIEFDGNAAKVNTYLNQNLFGKYQPDYKLDEEHFISQWKNLKELAFDQLDLKDLPLDFKNKERKRIKYIIGNVLAEYPTYYNRMNRIDSYTPSKELLHQLDNWVAEDEGMYNSPEYRNAFKGLVQMNSRVLLNNLPQAKRLLDELKFIQMRIQDQNLIDYLANESVTEYLRYYGTDDIESAVSFYEILVKDNILKEDFRSLYNQYNKLAKGKKAPEFKLFNMDDKVVNLSDFSGNYVYIDVWATWCGPCLKEAPYFIELEKLLSDNNIKFISVSIDQKKEDWKKKIFRDNVSGIQLHVDSNSTFKNDYKISLIPRFILIDPKGCIVDSKMTRPSDPNTLKFLKEILEPNGR